MGGIPTMENRRKRTLRVGAIQTTSENGQVEANLARTLPLVEEAAHRGAELILLPEFLPSGYVYSTAMWDAAEPREGPTVRWLKEHALRLGVYLGTSYLEADGDDFFNTFLLATPDGTEAGRVRKQTPAAYEAFFTTGDPGPHVIETPIGRAGVAICYENQLAYTPGLMHARSVDLMLMPHSAPTPALGPFVPSRQIDLYEAKLRGLALFYANHLGIPTVMVNKCGPWESPLPGLPFLPQRSCFPGLSTVADSDGIVKAQLDHAEGIIVENVVLDPARKALQPPRTRGRWFGGVPWMTRLFVIIEALGSLWYGSSLERKRRARAVSSV
jgi:N-carbamoylputrescine amidase